MLDGVKLAVSEINAKGGVLGRKIDLIERDDQADNSRGLQVTQELVNKEGVVASVGFINTGVALTAQRVYEEAKIPVINNVATGFQITKQFLPPDYPDNYVFRTSANDTIQSAMIVHEAIDNRKFTKVAILADSTNYGQLGREDLEKALAAKGITPVAVEKFNIKDTDMTAQLLKSKEAGAQAILTYGIGPELAQIANGMEKLGWKVPMIGSWTLSMGNFIDNAGKNGEGATHAGDVHPGAQHAKAQGIHRCVPESLQSGEWPYSLTRFRSTGLRLHVPAGGCDPAGREHRWREDPRGAGKSEHKDRRRRDYL